MAAPRSQDKTNGTGRAPFHASPELFAALDQVAAAVHAKAGDCLFREGTPASGVYLLRAGSVRAYLVHNDGRDIVNRILGPGAILGVPAAMCARPFQFTAEAVDHAHLGFVETSALNDHLRTKPELCMQVVKMMSDELLELRQAHDHMKNCKNTSCSLHRSCNCSE